MLAFLSLLGLALAASCSYYVGELDFSIISNVAMLRLQGRGDCFPAKVEYKGDPAIIGAFTRQTADEELPAVFTAPADASRAHVYNVFTITPVMAVTEDEDGKEVINQAEVVEVYPASFTKGQWCYTSNNVRAVQAGGNVYVYLQNYECEDLKTDLKVYLDGAKDPVELESSYISSQGYLLAAKGLTSAVKKVRVEASYWTMNLNQEYDVEQIANADAMKKRHCFRSGNIRLWEVTTTSGPAAVSGIAMSYVDTTGCIQFTTERPVFIPSEDETGKTGYENTPLRFTRGGFSSGGTMGTDPVKLPASPTVAAVYPGFPDSKTTLSSKITLDSYCHNKAENLQAVMLDNIIAIQTVSDNCCRVGESTFPVMIICTGSPFCGVEIDWPPAVKFYNSYGVRQWELNLSEGIQITELKYFDVITKDGPIEVSLPVVKLQDTCVSEPLGIDATYMASEKNLYLTVYTTETCYMDGSSFLASVDGDFYDLSQYKRGAKSSKPSKAARLSASASADDAPASTENGFQYVISRDSEPKQLTLMAPVEGVAKAFNDVEIKKADKAPAQPKEPGSPEPGLSTGALIGIIVAVVVVVALVIFLCVFCLVCKKRKAANAAVA